MTGSDLSCSEVALKSEVKSAEAETEADAEWTETAPGEVMPAAEVDRGAPGVGDEPSPPLSLTGSETMPPPGNAICIQPPEDDDLALEVTASTSEAALKRLSSTCKRESRLEAASIEAGGRGRVANNATHLLINH